MLTFFNKRLHNKKGFTLIELIVVIAILGVLAAIAIPRFTGTLDNAELKADQATARTIVSAVALAQAEGTISPATAGRPTVAELESANYLSNIGDSATNSAAFTITYSGDWEVGSVGDGTTDFYTE
jgi:prepilin-type N-terminal cleavage/methylation domain-containing protein